MKRLPWVERKFDFDIPPGWIQNILARLQGTEILMVHYTKHLPDTLVSERRHGRWSIKEHIGHLADLESLHKGRLVDLENRKTMLRAADMTNTATEKADHNSESLTRLIANFCKKRKEFIDKLKSLDLETQQFVSFHPRLKENMRIVDVAYFAAEHDDHHLASIKAIIHQK